MVRCNCIMSLTREELRVELERYPTKEDLREELSRYATKEDLREDLSRYATKNDLAEMRTHLVMLMGDLKSTMITLFDGLKARADTIEARYPAWLADHERRISGVETRVTVLESGRKRRQ